MVDKDIINFIKSQKEKNYSEKKIRNALIKVGFKKSEVKLGFKYIEDETKTLEKLKKDLADNKLELKKSVDKSKPSQKSSIADDPSNQKDFDVDDDLEDISFFTDESSINVNTNDSSLNKNNYNFFNDDQESKDQESKDQKSKDQKSKDQKFWDNYKFKPKKKQPKDLESFKVNFKKPTTKDDFNSNNLYKPRNKKSASLSNFQKIFIVFGLLFFVVIIFFFLVPNNFFSLSKITSELETSYSEKKPLIIASDCNGLDQYACYANPRCEVIYDRTGGYLTYIECRST